MQADLLTTIAVARKKSGTARSSSGTSDSVLALCRKQYYSGVCVCMCVYVCVYVRANMRVHVQTCATCYAGMLLCNCAVVICDM